MLSDFAKHTRQSEQERSDVTQLGKKYLAVHCNLAPMPLVYAQVASDYKLLELRTFNPSIHDYARFRAYDPDTFVHLMKDGFEHCKGPIDVTERPCLSQFIDHFFPKPVDQEAWEAWHNDKDTWKQRAYFLSLNCNEHAEFYEIVQKIAGSEASKDYVSKMYSALNAYKAKMPECKAEELGSIINDLRIECMSKKEPQPERKKDSQKEEEADDIEGSLLSVQQQQQNKLSFVEGKALESTAVPEAVQEYRKRAGLNVIFPVARLAKQVMLSALGMNGTERAEFEKIRGRDQDKFMPFDTTRDLEVLESVLTGVVEPAKLASLLNEHAANETSLKSSPFASSEPMEPVSFMRNMIGMYAPQSPASQTIDRQTRAYLKQWPKPCEALINVILNL
ncbi:MAG: hypothetical protein K2Q45_03205 [Nitrosomonas sp.]|nr:hypothetical protein [Nitrosomonas sp.]